MYLVGSSTIFFFPIPLSLTFGITFVFVSNFSITNFDVTMTVEFSKENVFYS